MPNREEKKRAFTEIMDRLEATVTAYMAYPPAAWGVLAEMRSFSELYKMPLLGVGAAVGAPIGAVLGHALFLGCEGGAACFAELALAEVAMMGFLVLLCSPALGCSWPRWSMTVSKTLSSSNIRP